MIMWITVAAAIAAIWIVVAVLVALAIGRALDIADTTRRITDGDAPVAADQFFAASLKGHHL